MWSNPGISYKLRDKDAIGGRIYYIAIQERKIYDMEIEIATFVINGGMKLTVHPDRKKYIQVRSRSVALCRVLSQVQRDKSGPGNSQTLGCLWTKHHRCTYM